MTTEIVPVEEQQSFAPVPMPPDRQPARVYTLSVAPGTGRSIVYSLNLIAQAATGGRCDAYSFPWWELRYQHVVAIRAFLQQHYENPAMVNQRLKHVRKCLEHAWKLGLMSADDYQLARSVQDVPNHTLPKGRALSQGEIRALLEACVSDDSAKGVRDLAILALLYGAGLRRSELPKFDLADYNVETGALAIRQAKGGKDRIVYATNGSKTALDEWLQMRGSEAGPLFLPIRRGGHVEHRRMSDQAVFNVLAERAEQAGIEDVSPHDLRRTFISDLLDAGADISAVQRLAGHASVTTTTRYDRRGEKAKLKAAELLHVPLPARRKQNAPTRKLVKA